MQLAARPVLVQAVALVWILTPDLAHASQAFHLRRSLPTHLSTPNSTKSGKKSEGPEKPRSLPTNLSAKTLAKSDKKSKGLEKPRSLPTILSAGSSMESEKKSEGLEKPRSLPTNLSAKTLAKSDKKSKGLEKPRSLPTNLTAHSSTESDTKDEAPEKPRNAVVLAGTLKQNVDVWMMHLLAHKGDVKECANETAMMMKELRYAYSRRQVPDVLHRECDNFLYYEKFGNDTEVCHAIVQHLIHTWNGDKDYETWCKDVYSKRFTAKDASEIPVKEDPGPRKGKYADVEDFSFPNDADPERACHGARPCNSSRAAREDKRDAKTEGTTENAAKDEKEDKKKHAAVESSAWLLRPTLVGVLGLLFSFMC